ncbi:putative RNA recognition motif domain, nucleotide-binding alpha-beta plait domain superfamily [Dioscorea sansibarensis]
MSYPRRSRSGSRSLSRSSTCSRSPDFSDAENPGNNLYVTGLSPHIKNNELEKHFSSEGKVVDVHLVVDPWSGESRGFGFVTMATIEDANRCLKYLDGSVLEGRVITVEKLFIKLQKLYSNNQVKPDQAKSDYAIRRRGRTPTPGRYLVQGPSILGVELPVILHIIEADTDRQAIHMREIGLTLLATGGTDPSQGQNHHTTDVIVSGDADFALGIQGPTHLCTLSHLIIMGATTGCTPGVTPQEFGDIQGVFLPEEEVGAILAAFPRGQIGELQRGAILGVTAPSENI